jgi:DNA polymerase I-like protein with 3'-5' exonuclease and polymerase domains/uracil-DNA glycosylase
MVEMSEIFVEGGYYATAARNMAFDSQEAMLEYALHTPFRINDPFDPSRTAMSLPPRQIGGVQPGPVPSEVLVVVKAPTRDDVNTGQLMNPMTSALFHDLSGRGIDCRSWVVTSAVFFSLPESDKIKAGDLKECAPLFEQTLLRVKPKFILVLGKEAWQQTARLFGVSDKERPFTTVKNVPFDLPNGVRVVVGYPPSVAIKMPSLLGEYNRAIDLFAAEVAHNYRLNEPLPRHLAASVEAKADLIVSTPYRLIETIEDLREEIVRFEAFFAPRQRCLMAIDVEWGRRYHLVTVQFCYSKDDVVVFNFRAGGRDTELGANESWVCDQINRVWSRVGVVVAGHNARQDIDVLRNRGIDLYNNFINGGLDTLVGYHMIPGNESKLEKDLLAVGMELVGIGRYDTDVNTWKAANKQLLASDAFMFIPKEVLLPYAAMDVWVGYMICQPIVDALVKDGVWELYYKHEHPLNRALLEMESLGLPIDEERLAVLSDLCVAKIAEIDHELQVACNWLPSRKEGPLVLKKDGTPAKRQPVVVDNGFNPASSTHVREILFGHYNKDKHGLPKKVSPPEAVCFNLTPIKSTDDVDWAKVVKERRTHLCNPSTDGESLAILARDCTFATTLAERSQVEQLRRTFTGLYKRDPVTGKFQWEGGLGAHTRDGITYTRYRTTLRTGRFATSPNHQNLPKRREPDLIRIFNSEAYRPLRSAILAPPGCVLIEADWNQAELWTMGGLARDDEFLHMLATSDVHTETCIRMFPDFVVNGKTLKEWGAKAVNSMRKEIKELDQRRSIAKTVVFGVPYGRGRAAIAREIQKGGGSCTVEQAGSFLAAFSESSPKIAEWIAQQKQLVINPGVVSNPYGRKRRFPPTPDRSVQAANQREGVNFPKLNGEVKQGEFRENRCVLRRNFGLFKVTALNAATLSQAA